MSRRWAGLITVLALGIGASNADATVLVSNTADGLSASASFEISGPAGARQLTILLTNTDASSGAGAPTVPSQVLTGLFFNLGTATFDEVSATLEANASIIQTSQCIAGRGRGSNTGCAGQTNVGGEFSYASGGVDWLDGTTQGISSSGYLNGNTNSGSFGGTNWQDPAALDGINFGILPDGWSAVPNGGLQNVPLIEGTVKFVLNIPDGLEESDIDNVYFTYGTSANEGTLPGTTSNTPTTSGTPTTGGVPEPATLSMLGLALGGIAYRLKRRSR